MKINSKVIFFVSSLFVFIDLCGVASEVKNLWVRIYGLITLQAQEHPAVAQRRSCLCKNIHDLDDVITQYKKLSPRQITMPQDALSYEIIKKEENNLEQSSVTDLLKTEVQNAYLAFAQSDQFQHNQKNNVLSLQQNNKEQIHQQLLQEQSEQYQRQLEKQVKTCNQLLEEEYNKKLQELVDSRKVFDNQLTALGPQYSRSWSYCLSCYVGCVGLISAVAGLFVVKNPEYQLPVLKISAVLMLGATGLRYHADTVAHQKTKKSDAILVEAVADGKKVIAMFDRLKDDMQASDN